MTAIAGWSTEIPDQYEIEGELHLWEQEGGFASSEIEIGGESLDVLIAEKFGGKVKRESGQDVTGTFHITIRRLKT